MSENLRKDSGHPNQSSSSIFMNPCGLLTILIRYTGVLPIDIDSSLDCEVAEKFQNNIGIVADAV
jgi:hypothetical protein